jgi:transcriptional regulator GlxA family with amidase domain
MNQRDVVSLVSTTDQSATDGETIASGREVMAPWQARCIQAYIAVNVHSTIRVMDLVAVVRFAPNRFDRVFKKTFDCTPHQYVMRIRIAHAQRLLLGTDDTLSKIAAACGFGNQSHLSNLFRKMTGQSPGKWRRAQSMRALPLQSSDYKWTPSRVYTKESDENRKYVKEPTELDAEML